MKKAKVMVLRQRRIQATIERNKRGMASWQARTTECEKLAVELTVCIYAVETMIWLWEVSGDEAK